ncbi:MAG TPA: hypothetical protein GXZ52_05770 [Clostridiales bacterium]|nr:hypothetical protein [Clostridiales bacterium]
MKRKFPLIAVAVLAVAVLALLVSRYGRSIDSDTPAVVLPSAVVGENMDQEPDDQEGSAQKAEVTPKTVQAVLATLSRADSYSRSITVESFYEGGGSKTEVNVWVRGDSVRITEMGQGETKNILIVDNDVYIWHEDSSKHYVGSLSRGDADKYQHLLTYEDILTLDPDQITDAGYTEYGGESCIFAEYRAGTLGYIYRIYVSVKTGLLMGAESYDGNTVIYRMTSDIPDISTPPDEVFALPA